MLQFHIFRVPGPRQTKNGQSSEPECLTCDKKEDKGKKNIIFTIFVHENFIFFSRIRSRPRLPLRGRLLLALPLLLLRPDVQGPLAPLRLPLRDGGEQDAGRLRGQLKAGEEDGGEDAAGGQDDGGGSVNGGLMLLLLLVFIGGGFASVVELLIFSFYL